MTNQTTDQSPPKDGGLTSATSLAIPVAYGLIVGVLGALGITGDVLTRLLRNDPERAAWSFMLAILAVVIPLVAHFALASSSEADRVSDRGRIIIARSADVVGGVLLVLAAFLAIFGGVDSIGAREHPDIQIINAARDSESAELTFTGTALSLRTDDRLILRVVAFKDVSAAEANESCRTGADPTPAPDQNGRPLADFDLVALGDAGPTATGVATTSVSVGLSLGAPDDESSAGSPGSDEAGPYDWVCAMAALNIRADDAKSKERFSALLVDLSKLPEE